MAPMDDFKHRLIRDKLIKLTEHNILHQKCIGRYAFLITPNRTEE